MIDGQWTTERANAWYDGLPWLVGCNYLPSTAINQLEMWQAETFDLPTIERELGWAEGLGFNVLRVYLHDLLWQSDRDGFVVRIERFLACARRHGMRVILVLFDDCHEPEGFLGRQPLPLPGVHNSGWVHSPGQSLVRQFHAGAVPGAERQRLECYIHGVLTRFSGDDRIILWDIYNEPGQSGNRDTSSTLLRLTWEWARAANPSQPLTACLQGTVGAANRKLNADNSDIVTFHGYHGASLERDILENRDQNPGRPLLCTEYMARELGTTFEFSLPIFQRERIGCINWGLVAGKSQTHWNWDSKRKAEALRRDGICLGPADPIPEPPLWFHDIFRIDGKPYDERETAFISAMLR